MALSELPEYVAEVRSVKSPAGLRVLLGFEADWLGEVSPVLPAALAHDPDLILGSVHFLGPWAFDDPSLIEEWESRDVLAVWEQYFTEVIAAAESGAYDVMAHPDLVKKFCHRPSEADMSRLYDAAAAAFAGAGVAIEVSTGGLRKPCAEIYPSPDFLKACFRAGVPATTGSDSHSPGEVGFRLDTARSALADAGYSDLVYFERRERRVGDL